MFVCEVCHKKLCSTQHMTFTYGPCELCRKEAECFDCVASTPITKEELEAAARAADHWRKHSRAVYLNTRQLKYPKDGRP